VPAEDIIIDNNRKVKEISPEYQEH
jgi:hypothetical protein